MCEERREGGKDGHASPHMTIYVERLTSSPSLPSSLPPFLPRAEDGQTAYYKRAVQYLKDFHAALDQAKR